MNLENEYRLTDFPLTITLLCFEFEIKYFDETNPRKIEFVFDNNKKLQELVKNYWSNKLLVNPKSFYYAEKDLKSRIRQIYRG